MRLDQRRSDVVLPVVVQLLNDDEVETISLAREPAGGRYAGSTVLRLLARGESFDFFLLAPGQVLETPPEQRERLADGLQLADALQEVVAESTFAWGQLRPHPF